MPRRAARSPPCARRCSLLAAPAAAQSAATAGSAPSPRARKGIAAPRPRPAARLPGLRDQEHHARGRRATRPPTRPASPRPSSPGPAQRHAPAAVALVDQGDWQAGDRGRRCSWRRRCARRSSSPTASDLPDATEDALARARARPARGRAAAPRSIRVGDGARPAAGCAATDVPGADPFALAARDRPLPGRASGKPSSDARDRRLGRATRPTRCRPRRGRRRRGDPVLFVKRDAIPAPTRTALTAHQQPQHLRARPARVDRRRGREPAAPARHGDARSPGADPVSNAIAFARYTRRVVRLGRRGPRARARVRERQRARSTRPPPRRCRRAAPTARCCSSTERRHAAARRSSSTCSTSSPATRATRCAASTITAGSSATTTRASRSAIQVADRRRLLEIVAREARPADEPDARADARSDRSARRDTRSPSRTCAS